MRTNPVRSARLALGLTLKGFSKECAVHEQAVYLTEQGVFPHIFPRIVYCLVTMHGYNAIQLQKEYKHYQIEKRKATGEQYGLALLDSPPVGDFSNGDSQNPFVVFRESLTLSRMKFAKLFCVHPALLHRLETGQSKSLPDQLVEAFVQAGLSKRVIDELDYRISE